ncbi:MAG: RcnB family protein [Alphaproteobacteria bacterium]
MALAVVATTGFAGTANAAPNYQQSQQRDDHRNDNNFRNGAYEVNGHRYERQRGPAWHQPKNWQHHNWKRGQRLPVEYRRTVVSDYRNYHLAPPPRGYQYVRDGNDVVADSDRFGHHRRRDRQRVRQLTDMYSQKQPRPREAGAVFLF